MESRVLCLSAQPRPEARPLISISEAMRVARVFKTLANDTRLRMLHALVRVGELSVSDLAAALQMTPQAVSNQLGRLVDQDVLVSRRSGSSVLYRVDDPCIPVLLDLGLCVAEDAVQFPSDAAS